MIGQSQQELLTLTVDVAATKPAGEPLVVSASTEQRHALASCLSVESVSTFQFKGKIARFRKTGLRLSGEMQADIVQPCVVSLEPVPQKINLDIDRRFLPERDLIRENERIEAGELLLDPEDDNEIDELVSGRIDIWEVLIEETSLAVDPFPRHPKHASVTDQKTQVDEPDEDMIQPFAALKTLISEKKSKK